MEELIDRIVKTAQISSRKRRQDIQRELRTHIEDFVIAACEAGHNQDEIEKLVLAHLGDPGEIAQGFAWVYRGERRRLGIFAYTLSTVLLAGSLLAAILAMQTALALSFGPPFIEVLAGRHMLIEAFNILASVAAYMGVTALENIFRKHRFQKAAFLLTLLDSILVVSFAAAGLHTTFLLFGLVNGLFCRALQLFVTPKVARAGIIVVCFPVAGLALALQRSPVSQVALAATCASWLAMGIGYLLMTHLAARVDRALVNGLMRIQ